MIYMNLLTPPPPPPSMRAYVGELGSRSSNFLITRSWDEATRTTKDQGQASFESRNAIVWGKKFQKWLISKPTHLRYKISKNCLTWIYICLEVASRANSELEMVIQDYCDWRSYVQDRQLKKDCQTAVTAVWELSSEEVNHFMKNMFWLLL